MENETKKNNRRLKGTVVSAKMTKTVVVRVDSLKKHAKYLKYFKVSKRYKAHAEEKFDEGDVVMIEETRPLSKEKRWKVVEKLSSGKKIELIDEEDEPEIVGDVTDTGKGEDNS